MSIKEIEKNLPNGLHDAVMLSHKVDYEKRSIEFHLNVWVGSFNPDDKTTRERYKKGILRFDEVEYFIIEPPFETKIEFEPFSFNAGEPEKDKIKPSVILPETPDGAFKLYFYIYKLNSFMHICARHGNFKYCT